MRVCIFATRPRVPTNPHCVGTHWRWSLDLFGGWRHLVYGTHAGLDLAVELKQDGKWGRGNGYYSAWVSTKWSWGEAHDYYDGPHCARSLGFLHFAWQRQWCPKCEEDLR
jgi:hypothetical protein